MQLIKAFQYKTMPWKNGGGQTSEIAYGYALNSAEQAPDWRVSIATISQSGPFSNFIDIDRTITLLKGDDVVLTINDDDHVRLSEGGLCFSFKGEEKVYATLTKGASTDLNIMTNRHYYCHHMQRLDKPLPQLDEAKIIKLFLVALSALDVTLGHDRIAMEAFDTLMFDNGDFLNKIPFHKQLILIAVIEKAA